MEIKPLDMLRELEVQPIPIDSIKPLEVTPMNTEVITTITEPDEIACDIPTIDAADFAELDELREEMQRDFEELENDPDIKRMLRESEKELDALTACDSLDGSESTSCSGS